MAIAKDQGGEREPTPCGLQNAICVFEVDVGAHVNPMSEKKQHKIVLFWELEERMTEGDNLGKPFMVSKIYTLSLNDKATLRKDIESWFGKKFTVQQVLEGFDTAKLVGRQCTLTLVENDKGYANVTSIAPVQKNATKLKKYNTVAPDWAYEMAKKSVDSPEVDLDAVNAENAMAASEEDPFADM